MKIKLNGDQKEIQGPTLADLVQEQGLNPSSLIIEHNLAIVRQENWGETRVREGDTVELLNFVGGG